MKCVAEVVRDLEKRFGDGVVVRGSDCKAKLRRFSSGCFGVDVETGGGFPEGRITLLYGQPSSTKTTLALKAAKEFLLKYSDGKVIFVDAEHALDVGWVQKLGVDMTRFSISSPDSGEQAVDILCAFLQAKEPVLVISDSLATFVPTKELEESADKGMVGVQARLINRLMRRASSLMARNLTREEPCASIIFLNQTREAIGAYGDPTTLPGGKGQLFHSSLSINLRRSGWLLNEDGEDKKKVGMTVAFEVRKSKVWRPHTTGEFNFYFADYRGHKSPEIDNIDCLIREAEVTGAVERRGHSWALLGKSYKGRDAFASVLAKDAKMRKRLADDVMNLSGIHEYYLPTFVTAKKERKLW